MLFLSAIIVILWLKGLKIPQIPASIVITEAIISSIRLPNNDKERDGAFINSLISCTAKSLLVLWLRRDEISPRASAVIHEYVSMDSFFNFFNAVRDSWIIVVSVSATAVWL